VNWIKGMLTQKKAAASYQKCSVLIGSKGIGKTTAVKTAANGLQGVIIIPSVSPGTTEKDIVEQVCEEINGSFVNNHKESAKSIIEAYTTISGGQAPILIIQASMRDDEEQPAALTASGRTLTEDFKLNVLIDAAENAMPNKLTLREHIREMTPMTDEMIRQLPQFTQLFEYLNAKKNDQFIEI
jgi:NAD(P)-dependent dehydrogenase (short-subunit alcohol dehydrogenase family)